MLLLTRTHSMLAARFEKPLEIIHWHDDHTNSCKIFCNQLHGIFMLLNYIVINLIERK